MRATTLSRRYVQLANWATFFIATFLLMQGISTGTSDTGEGGTEGIPFGPDCLNDAYHTPPVVPANNGLCAFLGEGANRECVIVLYSDTPPDEPRCELSTPISGTWTNADCGGSVALGNCTLVTCSRESPVFDAECRDADPINPGQQCNCTLFDSGISPSAINVSYCNSCPGVVVLP